VSARELHANIDDKARQTRHTSAPVSKTKSALMFLCCLIRLKASGSTGKHMLGGIVGN